MRAIPSIPDLDARYEKVRQDGAVRDAAALIAVGVDASGKRQILGVSVALSERDAPAFLQIDLDTIRQPSGAVLVWIL